MSRTDTIEGYLDALFDRLAGTGAAGRRALAEAEDHLRTATAEAMDRGVDREAAERAAVAQFGDVPTFALALRRAYRPGPLAVLVSNGWLLAGFALAGAAVAFLLTALDRVVEAIRSPDAAPYCVSDGLSDCPPQSPRLLACGVVAAVLAVALFAGRSLARRRAGLVASSRALPVVVAMASAVLVPILFFGPAPDPVEFNLRLFGTSGPGIYFTVFAAATAAAGSLAAAAWAVVRGRRAPLTGEELA